MSILCIEKNKGPVVNKVMLKCFSLKCFFLNKVQKTLTIKKNKHKNACSFFIGFQEQTHKHSFAKAPCGT